MLRKSNRRRLQKRLFLEPLEPRLVLTGVAPHSFAFDLIDLYEMRRLPDFDEIDGDEIGIAIIDTGVDSSHELLTNRVVANVDLVYANEGNYFTSNHGTHVAGIAAASDPNIGVAPQANLISLQVFSETDGYSSWVEILEALQWVRENHYENNIKVVNMSLGGGLFANTNDAAAVTQDVYREILNLERLGITVVSAAGNEFGIDRNGQNQMIRNANAPGIYSTLVVGAVWESYEGGGICMGDQVCDVTTASDRIVHFSQRPPDQGNVVFAPGAFILSSVPGDELQELAGTSMASPMVAGAVALMQDAAMTFGGRYLTTAEVQQLIRESADVIHDGDDENSITTVDGVEFAYTNAEYPRLNIHQAVSAVRELVETPAQREDRYAVNSGDANSTLVGAYQGPVLPLRWSVYDNDPTEAVKLKGILGKDGRRFESGDADVDMFKFELSAPGVVILQTEAWGNREPADTLLRLFDSNGTPLAANDNYDDTTFSHLEAALPVGVYYVGVSGSGNDTYSPLHPGSGTSADRGHYKLAFSWANDDLNGFLDTAVQVSFNQGETSFQGLIGQDYGTHVGTQDVDLFRLVVPDDGKVLVDIDTPYLEGYVDSFLRVFDADGNELVYSDDDLQVDEFGNPLEFVDGYYPGYIFEHPTDRQYFDGHTLDSFVMGTDLEQGQVLYFGVSGQRNHSYNPMSVDGRRTTYGGFYEVEFEFISKDLTGNINQAMPLPDANTWYEELIYFDWDSVLGDWVEVSEKDIDFYSVTPTISGVLEFDVDSYVLEDNEDDLDSVITVFDSAGNYIAQRDWDFVQDGSWDSKIHLASTAGETVYFAVSGLGNQAFDPFLIGDAVPGDTGYYQMKWDQFDAGAYEMLTDDKLTHQGILDLAVGDVRSAEIGYDDTFVLTAEDVDLYRFAPTESGDYMVWTDSSQAWSADTVLRLFDSQGAELAQNDDDPYGGLGSFLHYEFTGGETYYFGVSGYHEGDVNYDPNTGEGAMPGSMGHYYLSLAPTDMPPTIEAVEDIELDEDSGDVVLDLTGLSSGIDESQQFMIDVFISNDDLLDYELTHDNSASTGRLELSFPEHANGSSSIVLQLMDSGYDQDLDTLEDNQFYIEEFAVVVNQVNDEPIASNGVYELRDNQTLDPGFDSDLFSLVDDPDVNRLTFTQVTPPEYGTLLLRDGGAFEYVPNTNFNRVDSFEYKVTDGTVTTDAYQVTIEMVTDYLWFNGSSPGDINDDGQLVPMDALSVINRLNAGEGGALPTEREHGMQAPFWDASRDNQFSPLDALVVINELNTFLEGEAQAEGEFWPGLVDDRMEGDEDWLRTIDQNEERLAAPENWNDTPGEIQRTIDSFVTELELIDREAVEDRSGLKIADELELNLPS
ncbi:MAG: hypothetical protein CMM06_07320 [Rhodopirellula sp.]|nr:hypothetical protein [Rhodopirellula sp.]|tara:strand:+ start:25815 stop:29927 length:4113 start_codon:yes stop_codon:yes gene_type:complete